MNYFLAATSTSNGFMTVINPIISLLDNLTTPLLALVGAIGTIYCIFLGVKFAKADEPQEREKAKSSLKNAIIGFLLIFVLIVALKLMMPVMTAWMAANQTPQ